MKILVGIDGSEHGWDTLKYAISEAKLKKAKLTAIHSQLGKWRKTAEEAWARETLEKAKRIMQDEGIEADVRFLVRGFLPAVDIVKFAEENGYDHIVVGSHGKSGIDRILLGSVADGVVHRAHCPVTVFR